MSAAWIVLSLTVGKVIAAFAPALWQDFAREEFSAILLFGGFYWMARKWVPDLRPLSSVGLVFRPGANTEFGIGIAFGWAIALALVLPAVLTGNVSFTFGFNGIALYRMLISAATLIAFACVVQLVIAGLPVRFLLRSTGPTRTMAAVIVVAVALTLAGNAGSGSSFLFTALAAALFTTGFLRTRALWLPLGLQLGWTLSLALIFGAGSPYEPPSYGIIQGDTGGPAWLTGGPFGPEASAFAIVVLIAAIVILVRITRDYAWHYTYEQIVAQGQAVVIAPSAEHLKEEQRAAEKAVPLVQIGGLGQTPPQDPIL